MAMTNPGLQTAIDLEHSFLTKFKASLDGCFNDTEAAVPKIVGEEIAFGESWLETHATGFNLQIVDGVLALGGQLISTGAANLATVAVAQLVNVSKTVDAQLAAHGATA